MVNATAGSTVSWYTQADLAHGATKEQTWQSMLMPPKRN
jgi:hypothetical protein